MTLEWVSKQLGKTFTLKFDNLKTDRQTDGPTVGASWSEEYLQKNVSNFDNSKVNHITPIKKNKLTYKFN